MSNDSNIECDSPPITTLIKKIKYIRILKYCLML